jgi:CDP-glycerol glycerophosphotransferase
MHTAVRRLMWTTPTILTIRGWAYLDEFDLADTPTQITLRLTNSATGQTRTVPTSPDPDPSISALSADNRRTYDNAGFTAAIDTTEWPDVDGGQAETQTWQVDVHVRTAGVEAVAPLTDFDDRGSAGVPQARDRADGLRTEWRVGESGQLILRRYHPPVQLVHGSIDQQRVSLIVRAGDATVRTLTLRDAAHDHELSAGIDWRADGTGSAVLSLPAADADRHEWSVTARTADGQMMPVAWASTDATSDPDRPDEQFEGTWLARTPTGELAVVTQPQRCQLLLARCSDDASTLIVDADLDGDGEVAATLEGDLAAPTGALTRAGRELQLRFPLTASRWGGPTLPVPPGRYDLRVHRDAGPAADELVLELADELLAELPIEVEHPRLRGRIERTDSAGRLCLTVMPPLAPEERGVRHQRDLRAHHATLARDLAPSHRSHSVLFRASYGENAGGNAAAVHRELRRRGADLDLYWAVTDYSVAVPDGGIPVIHDSHAWYHLLATADYFIDNMHQPIYHAKPAHQVVVETFHGYPFKTMGHPHWDKLGLGKARIDSFDRRAREWDYLVSPASYATPLLRRDFRYDGEVLEIGYPRNDILLSPEAPARRTLIRQRLGVAPDQLVVLYAPTFRDYLSGDDHHAEMVDFLDLERVAEAFGDDAVLLLRAHAFNARARGLRRPAAGSIIDVTLYPEVSDLYLAADAAIVDYSSLRFDFGLTGKPMIFLVPDLARYRDESRGWLFDFEPTAPGPFVQTTDEVLDAVKRLDDIRVAYRAAYEAFRRDYLDLDDGHASERFVDAVFVPRGDAPA